METEILVLDLVGTFAFACYGSYFAIRRGFDIFGVFVCGFLMALGGGTIREIILKQTPFYLFDSTYIMFVILGMIFALVSHRFFTKISGIMLLLDAIGLVTFALIGSSKAVDAGMGLFGILFFATLTSVGGGIMKDIVMNEIPEIMYTNFYASVAILLGFLYWLGGDLVNNLIFINALIIVCLSIRIIAVVYKIKLWQPHKDLTHEI